MPQGFQPGLPHPEMCASKDGNFLLNLPASPHSPIPHPRPAGFLSSQSPDQVPGVRKAFICVYWLKTFLCHFGMLRSFSSSTAFLSSGNKAAVAKHDIQFLRWRVGESGGGGGFESHECGCLCVLLRRKILTPPPPPLPLSLSLHLLLILSRTSA